MVNQNVICRFVFWDYDQIVKTEYAPGEFERLFADQTKIKLLYKDGISPLEIATLPALIQHLEGVKGCSLRFVSINEGAGGAVVELAIENTDNSTSEQVKQLQAALQTVAQQKSSTQNKLLLKEKGNCRAIAGS
jgi:hypothetical protein